MNSPSENPISRDLPTREELKRVQRRVRVLTGVQMLLIGGAAAGLALIVNSIKDKSHELQKMSSKIESQEKLIDEKTHKIEKLSVEEEALRVKIAAGEQRIQRAHAIALQMGGSRTAMDSTASSTFTVDGFIESQAQIEAVLQAAPTQDLTEEQRVELVRDLRVSFKKESTDIIAYTGSPTFQVTMALHGTPQALEQVGSVRYYFGHSSYNPKNKVGSNAANGFAITYLGLGCIDTVIVTAVLKDSGKEVRLAPFAFCEAWNAAKSRRK